MIPIHLLPKEYYGVISDMRYSRFRNLTNIPVSPYHLIMHLPTFKFSGCDLSKAV